MGCYDTYGEREIQIKSGECLLRFFNVGDECDLADGVHVGYEGLVVVKDGKFIAEYSLESLCDKWGKTIPIDLDSTNPFAICFKEVAEKYRDKIPNQRK